MSDTVPYYEDFTEIKKKIWSMLDNAVKDRSSSFRIPVFSCGIDGEVDGRIVVLENLINQIIYYNFIVILDQIKFLN